jgi:peptidoglycan hydrolase-like protein with peptidoglycan-binding domain
VSARRTAGVVAGVLTAGAVAAAVTVFNLPDAESGDSGTTAAPASTADITRQTLVDRENHDGSLGHGDTVTVAARGSGTATWLPRTGATIARGKALYRLDNRPVVLLYGSLPTYRTLQSGLEGADVKQFEKNLWALGYRDFTVDDEYTSATASAVREWQEDLGLSETGTVETSQIEYASTSVRVNSLSAQKGALVQPGTELVTVTGTSLVATVELDMDSQRLAKKGATVQVTFPDDKTVQGRITDVGTTVEEGQGEQEDVTLIKVTIAFTGKPTGMEDASVTVGFTASQRKDVLTVPVAALLALAEGGYGIRVVDGAASKIVAVETGLFADGRVEIEGDGLQPGMKASVPE